MAATAPVNDLFEQLLALTRGLSVAAGAPPDALAALRRMLVAWLIQQAPQRAPVPDDPDGDAALMQAAREGEALAAELSASGMRLRFVREPYLAVETSADRPADVVGPFIDDEASLVQFAFYRSARFRPVVMDLPSLFGVIQEIAMLLPADTVADDGDGGRFIVPAGTVWLRAHRLVAGTAGFVSLRVSGGTLAVDTTPVAIEPDGSLHIPFGTRWSLALEPEPPPPAQAGGSDADAVSLQLPARLELSDNFASVVVTGPLAMSGFGSELRFETPTGPAIAGGDAIAFPFEGAGIRWQVAGNRSPLFQFDGDIEVPAAAWSLPLSAAPVEQAGEGAHGGSFTALLRGGTLQSRLAGASGACDWIDTVLTANARGIEIEGRRAGASAAAELTLWRTARSELAFGDAQLAGLRHASRRGGADIVELQGGRLLNRWDLPRAAEGRPFGFAGAAESVTLIAEADSLWRAAIAASQDVPAATVQGFAFENLYLHVRPPRRLNLAGSGPAPARLDEGMARLRFDVRLAQPMLPDPYAASWTVVGLDERLAPPQALSVVQRWRDRDAPMVTGQFDRIRLPQLGGVARRDELRLLFDHHLQARPESLHLLDLSSRDHHFGVALESLSDPPPRLDDDNRLAVPLRHVRLLMQPQVHWEPVHVVPNPEANVNNAEVVTSTTQGGRTLVGANTVTLVPTLPSRVGAAIASAANGLHDAAALFALPFGLRAFTHMDTVREQTLGPPPIVTQLHEPGFDGELRAAQQLRLIATGRRHSIGLFGAIESFLDPARGMPGRMVQTDNLLSSVNGLTSVMSADAEFTTMLAAAFESQVPLHQADLSGYGLSSFSHWRRDPEPGQNDVTGVTKVRFDVVVGRTAYEVIEVRTWLAECQARVVRSIVLERQNSGAVKRFDSGWDPIDDGVFGPHVAFETGAVKAFRRIRNIRILNQPLLSLPGGWLWQAVLFDADADIADATSGGADKLMPMRDHAGYVQIAPVSSPAAPGADLPTAQAFADLFNKVGPIGGPIDARLRLAGTLDMQLSGIYADLALSDDNDPAKLLGFAVAVHGAPALPRAGQWSAVRIDTATLDVSPIDPRRGMPVVRLPGQPFYSFRDAADVRRERARAEYGFLMSTQASRVLFPQPRVGGGPAGTLTGAPPLVADPYALVQASSAFPRVLFALRCNEAPHFLVSAANEWKLANPDFSFTPPLQNLASGAEWGMKRVFPPAPKLRLGLDSALVDKPWEILRTSPDDLELIVEPFVQALFVLSSTFEAASGALPGLQRPQLGFGEPLKELKKVLDSLDQFAHLPGGLRVDVDVSAGSGPSPSFIVRPRLRLRLPAKMHERVDIGVGKFHGEFELRGELEAALSGKTRSRLTLEFIGDVQQGIIPPVLYAGGMFRFVIQISDTGKPLIEMGLGTTASIGGDLIKNVIELEATVKYGYTLIPQTLQPGVMLGIEARAKLLAGLVGLSFSADAMARIQRLNLDQKNVTVWAQLRLAATIEVAWGLAEDEEEIETQFEQKIPLQAVALAAGLNPLGVVAASELL